jgi:hypothetical protein
VSPLQLFLAKCWLHLAWDDLNCRCQFTLRAVFQIFYALTGAGADLRLALLRRNGRNIKDDIDILKIIPQASVSMRTLLACGVDPNYDKDPWDSPIFLVLWRAVETVVLEDDDACGGYVVDDMVDLLSAGADMYTIGWVENVVGNTFPDSPIVTPTMYVIERGVEHIWKRALRKAGFDTAEVYAEDERRLRELLRLHGATASAVQYEVPVDKDSSLRLRRGRVYDDDGLNGPQSLEKT